MKVLLSWLQEFAPVTGDPGEISDQLSELGLAVEGVTTVGAGLDGVVERGFSGYSRSSACSRAYVDRFCEVAGSVRRPSRA